jgi:hypothetical protein
MVKKNTQKMLNFTYEINLIDIITTFIHTQIVNHYFLKLF